MYSYTLPASPKRLKSIQDLDLFWYRLESYLIGEDLAIKARQLKKLCIKVKKIPSEEFTLFHIAFKKVLVPLERIRIKEAKAREAVEGIARLYGLNYNQYKWYLEEREGHILKDIITPNQFITGYWFKEGIGKEEFRKLALEHHPDKGGNVEVMAELNSIYRK